jgi:hypothetical protein
MDSGSLLGLREQTRIGQEAPKWSKQSLFFLALGKFHRQAKEGPILPATATSSSLSKDSGISGENDSIQSEMVRECN